MKGRKGEGMEIKDDNVTKTGIYFTKRSPHVPPDPFKENQESPLREALPH
jgi:hypothetical protein